MADLTVQNVGVAGLEATYADASTNGDKAAVGYGERVMLHVKNGHSSPQTVTVVAQTTSITTDGIGVTAVPNIAVEVTNAEDRFIGPFSSAYIGVDGKISITYSGVTNLTIAAIRLPAVSRNL